MKRPKPLKKGDKVALIATSGAVIAERIKPAVIAIQDLGLEVALGQSCVSNYGYLAGKDEVRAKDFNKMFEDKNIKGIFVIRGGYGASRILDRLDYEMIKSNPKVLIGYSDVTFLHNVINQRCGFITFHGPMAATELYKGIDKYTRSYLLKNLFTDEPLGEIFNPAAVKLVGLSPGIGRGQLVGGNLSIITSSLGTKYEIDTNNKILFIEEIQEEPYKIDRMITQLIQCDKFSNVQGLILGAFTNCEGINSERNFKLMDVLRELLLPLNIPIVSNLQCGHVLPTITMPMGAMVEVNGDLGKIRFLE